MGPGTLCEDTNCCYEDIGWCCTVDPNGGGGTTTDPGTTTTSDPSTTIGPGTTVPPTCCPDCHPDTPCCDEERCECVVCDEDSCCPPCESGTHCNVDTCVCEEVDEKEVPEPCLPDDVECSFELYYCCIKCTRQ